jgi:transcriptional regulator with XRE-family HTH domain
MRLYSIILSEAIEKSGLKLTKIGELVGVSQEYISRLQNGKSAPAADKVNEALAGVLNIDPLEIKAAAYREKIPNEVLLKICEGIRTA